MMNFDLTIVMQGDANFKHTLIKPPIIVCLTHITACLKSISHVYEIRVQELFGAKHQQYAAFFSNLKATDQTVSGSVQLAASYTYRFRKTKTSEPHNESKVFYSELKIVGQTVVQCQQIRRRLFTNYEWNHHESVEVSTSNSASVHSVNDSRTFLKTFSSLSTVVHSQECAFHLSFCSKLTVATFGNRFVSRGCGYIQSIIHSFYRFCI